MTLGFATYANESVIPAKAGIQKNKSTNATLILHGLDRGAMYDLLLFFDTFVAKSIQKPWGGKNSLVGAIILEMLLAMTLKQFATPNPIGGFKSNTDNTIMRY